MACTFENPPRRSWMIRFRRPAHHATRGGCPDPEGGTVYGASSPVPAPGRPDLGFLGIVR